MSDSILDMSSQDGPAFPPITAGKIILNGENPFIRLFDTTGAMISDASLWTVTYSPQGAGHALFIKSDLTANRWLIYTDNPALVGYLQQTVQGMLNPETSDDDIPVINATFSRNGDTQTRWEQQVSSDKDIITLAWSDFLAPILMAHEQASQLPERPYGVSLVMLPAQNAQLVVNGVAAAGNTLPCRYDGQPFSTSALAFSESWREQG